MKLRHFIIIALVIAVLGLMYYPVLKEKPTPESENPKQTFYYLPILVAKNKEVVQQAVAYGQITPNNQIDIVMQVQGVVERDNPSLKEGQTFQKNQLLIKLERTDALYNLLARRSSFSNLIAGVLPDISLDFPDQKAKWENYLDQLDPLISLAEFPESASRKERLLISARNIASEYYSIKASERQLENYYYLAPFDGTVVSGTVEPGQLISPGVRVATIAKINDYEVKAPINLKDLHLFSQNQEVTFTNPQGDTVGVGKMLRKAKTINQQTQSLDIFFNIRPTTQEQLYQGMFLNLNVTTPLFDNCVVLPDNAVINNVAQVLKDSVVFERKVQIVGTKRDSVYVIGITDEEEVVLTPYATPEDNTKFVGILK